MFAALLNLRTVGTVAALPCLYLLALAIYRLYFHPLAKYPGPKHLALTNLTHIYHVLRGEWVHIVLAAHELHGDVVRVGPNELSYVSEEAWSDIYKPHGKDSPQFQKHMPVTPPTWQHALFDQPSDATHQLIRKTLSPIMSDRGVREREDILLKYTSLMCRQLRRHITTTNTSTTTTKPSSSIDLTPYFQAVTTDIVGEFLTNGSFHALGDDNTPAPLPPPSFLPGNFAELKGLAIGCAFNRNSILRELVVRRNAPPNMRGFRLAAKPHWDRAVETQQDAKKEEEGAKQRETIFSLLTKSSTATKGDGAAAAAALPDYLPFTVFADFVLAGTDTVAITLLGAVYLLCTHPTAMKRWKEEVRGAFSREEDITLAGVNGLKYQNAVIQESLRLWPPGPETQRRIVPRGGRVVRGEWVPGGVFVGCYQWVVGRYGRAWRDVGGFRPERWLGREGEGEGGGKGGGGGFEEDRKGVLQSFNVGARNCVGQQLAMGELRVILAMLVWWFDLELEEEEEGEGKGKGWMDVKIFGLVAEKKPLRVKLTCVR